MDKSKKGRMILQNLHLAVRAEVKLASKFLNRMTRLGMPDSYRVA